MAFALRFSWRCGPLLVSLALAPTARADDAPAPCTLKLVPAEASDAWKNAARDVSDARLRPSAPRGADCRAILVEVADNVAFVLFTTRDGRQTIRRITSPGELAPAVDALLETVPLPPPPAPPTAPVVTAPVAPPAAPPAAPRNPPGEDRFHLDMGASTAARLGSPGGFASLALGLGAQATVARWEAGLLAEWEPAFTFLGSAPPPSFSMSSLAFGLNAGRRAPLGGALLAVGLTGGVAFIHEAGATSPSGSQTGMSMTSETPVAASSVDPRLGAYFAVVLPRGSRLRFRPQVGLDAVPTHLGSAYALDPSLPALPWWSVRLSLGVEGEVL